MPVYSTRQSNWIAAPTHMWNRCKMHVDVHSTVHVLGCIFFVMLQAHEVYCSFWYTHLCVILCAFPEFKLEEKPLLFVHTFVCILRKQLLTSNKNISHSFFFCCRTQAAVLQARFLWVLYSIINTSLILKRNKMCDKRNKPHLKRNKTHLVRNETRDGNLHLICTVSVKQILCLILYM